LRRTILGYAGPSEEKLPIEQAADGWK